jgi:hypothetical protein
MEGVYLSFRVMKNQELSARLRNYRRSASDKRKALSRIGTHTSGAKRRENPVFQKVSAPVRWRRWAAGPPKKRFSHVLFAENWAWTCSSERYLYHLLLEENLVTRSEIDSKKRRSTSPAFKMTLLQIKRPP